MRPADESLHEFLVIGLPVEVDVQHSLASEVEIYFSQIMELSPDEMLIAVPQRRSRVLNGLDRDETLRLRIMQADAGYAFVCRVLGWQSQPEGLRLSLPQAFERIQRRHFVRIDAVLPVVLTLPAGSHPNSLPELGPAAEALEGQVAELAQIELQTSTLDFSGGGMMVLLEQALPMHGELQGRVYLPSAKPDDPQQAFELVPFDAEVCRCDAFEGKYLVGLNFIRLPEPLRDRMIRYIFRYQRESLQNRQHLAL